MIVIDCFSGIGTARLALDRLGVTPEYYKAFELNKKAVAVAKANFPDIIEGGEIFGGDLFDLPGNPDLIIGGPPCQPFSVAGSRRLFDDPRAKCLWRFIDIVHHLHPRYFIMENVPMPLDCLNAISSDLGMEPYWIDSANFSAQRRLRCYWTNIPIDTVLPKSPLCIADIIEDNYLHHNWRDITEFSPKMQKRILTQIKPRTDKAYTLCKNTRSLGTSGSTTIQDPITKKIRMLTVREMERLQTFPDDYTASCPYISTRRAMIGNAFTCKVIEFLLKNAVNG